MEETTRRSTVGGIQIGEYKDYKVGENKEHSRRREYKDTKWKIARRD